MLDSDGQFIYQPVLYELHPRVTWWHSITNSTTDYCTRQEYHTYYHMSRVSQIVSHVKSITNNCICQEYHKQLHMSRVSQTIVHVKSITIHKQLYMSRVTQIITHVKNIINNWTFSLLRHSQSISIFCGEYCVHSILSRSSEQLLV